MYKFYVKRMLDISISIGILLALIPLFLLVALIIVLDSKGPAFFVQKRVGYNFAKFTLLKFRTMIHQKRQVSNKPVIGKAPGVTRIGYYLRRLKIDELPQLLNVVRGDMSLVGPRPSIPEQLENMTDQEKLRYSVRPGLTGLAQVSGNIHLCWKERYVFDLQYVNNISFRNDMKILLRTLVLIFLGEEKFIDKPLKLYVNK